MERFLGRYCEVIFTALRLVAGLMFAVHGAQKLFGAFGSEQVPLASLMGLAGVIEFVGGLLIAIGLFASWAAFIASGQMAVAYFMAHAPRGPLPPLKQGETAVLYCFLFLYIAARGPGRYSIDASMRSSAGR